MNYTEFYGDNGTQWSWYNVPQHIRDRILAKKPNLPVMGLDPNAPRTKFNKILSTHKVFHMLWVKFIIVIGHKLLPAMVIKKCF
jgi:hypothetical protein